MQTNRRVGSLLLAVFIMAGTKNVIGQTISVRDRDRQRQVESLLLEQQSPAFSQDIGAVGIGSGFTIGTSAESDFSTNLMMRPLADQARRPATTTGPTAQTSAFGPLQVSLRVGGGYDTNPRTRPNAEGAWFGELDVNPSIKFLGDALNSTFDPDFTVDKSLALNYEGVFRWYQRDFRDRDRITQNFGATYKQRLADDRTVAYVNLKDVWIHQNLSPLLNTFSVIPSVQHYWRHWLATEPLYSYTHTQVLANVPHTLDQSGDAHALGLNLTLLPQNDKFPADDRGPIPAGLIQSLTLGYAHTWNDADGAAQEYDGDRLIVKLVGLQLLQIKGLTMDLNYSHDWNNFRNLASDNGRRRRDDDIDTAGISVKQTFKLTDKQKLDFILNLNFTNSDSSFLSQEYDRSLVSGAVVWTF